MGRYPLLPPSPLAFFLPPPPLSLSLFSEALKGLNSHFLFLCQRRFKGGRTKKTGGVGRGKPIRAPTDRGWNWSNESRCDAAAMNC